MENNRKTIGSGDYLMTKIVDLMDIQSCDLLFTFNAKSKLSKIIWIVSKWNTNYPLYEEMSHVVMSMSDLLIVESSTGGVLIKSIETLSKKTKVITRGRVSLTPNQKRVILSYCKRQSGVTNYAYLQLFYSLFSKLMSWVKTKDKDDGVTCCEFLVDAFRTVDIDLAPGKEAHLSTPLDLYNSEHIHDRLSKRI